MKRQDKRERPAETTVERLQRDHLNLMCPIPSPCGVQGATGWTPEEMFAKNARDHNYKSEYDELEYT